MSINSSEGMNLLVSAIGIALGVSVMVAPGKAAAIWGSERLARLAPSRRGVFLRWYRAFGFILCLASILFALDTIGFR